MNLDQWKSLTVQQRLFLLAAWFIEFAPQTVNAWLLNNEPVQTAAITDNKAVIVRMLRGEQMPGITADWARDIFRQTPQQIIGLSKPMKFMMLSAERKAALISAVREIANKVDPTVDLSALWVKVQGEVAQKYPELKGAE